MMYVQLIQVLICFYLRASH